jgi:C1A family cysteine protease
MEALYNLQEKAQKNLSLSVEQHVSPCYMDQYSGSCFGGNILSVMYYTRQNGTVDETCFPYKSGNCLYKKNGKDECNSWCSTFGWCSNPPSCSLCYNSANMRWKISDYHKALNSSYMVKRALICHGPLVVCSSNWWHCVALVGWDDFKNAWVIKNSWGLNNYNEGGAGPGYGYIPYTGDPRSQIKDDAWYIDSIQKA